MPRIKTGQQPSIDKKYPDLVKWLTNELKSDHPVGQPVIHEHEFPTTGAIKTTVVWDKWNTVADLDREQIILQAYAQAESQEYADRIALAMGLTFPEAFENGMLPYQLIPLLRDTDSISVDECQQAMKKAGASLLFPSQKPELHFISEEEAQACLDELVRQWPQSKPIWTITKNLGYVT